MTENLPDTNVGNIEYISKQDAINCIEHMTWYHVNGRGQLVDGANSDTGLYKAKDVYKGLHDIPAIDVTPVVHGYWIVHENADTFEGYEVPMFECSNCRTWKDDDSDFCPDCGAMMDEAEEDNG